MNIARKGGDTVMVTALGQFILKGS
jgi:hypothetical protein